MPSTIEIDNGHCRIRMEGDMTIYTAMEQMQELISCISQSVHMEIDLSRVNEMDSAGLQLLMLLKREAGKTGKRLTLTSHSRAVTEIIDTFNMAAYFGDPIVLQDAA